MTAVTTDPKCQVRSEPPAEYDVSELPPLRQLVRRVYEAASLARLIRQNAEKQDQGDTADCASLLERHLEQIGSELDNEQCRLSTPAEALEVANG